MQCCRDLISAGNGALMGCIVITSGCAVLEPYASALGGIVGGIFLLPSSLFFLHVCKIDDPVDAVTVRAPCIGVLPSETQTSLFESLFLE